MSFPDDARASAIYRSEPAHERATVGTSTGVFVAPGSVTNGEYGLFRWEMVARGGGANAHIHRTFSEAFYVLDGTVELYDGVDWTPGTAGDFLYIPAHGIHGFRNVSDEPASMLILFAPGPPREAYFRELGERIASGRTADPEEQAAFLARHDQYMVE